MPLLVHTVISGGEQGADVAGIRAAKRLGLKTGGYAPRGWTTLDGPAPWLKDYGLVEHSSPGYAPRTAANVRAADATVRFASNFASSGERCTRAAIIRFAKPHHDVQFVPSLPPTFLDEARINDFRAFLTAHNVRILNVAGNSEITSPGIGAFVEAFLVRALGGSP